MKKVNLKFDIKKMTDEFNNVTYLSFNHRSSDNYCLGHLTTRQMSEMIQRHAVELGFKHSEEIGIINRFKIKFILIDDFIHVHNIKKRNFDSHAYEERGLEFFSIKPEPKMVTVKMTEESYKSMTGVPITESWELVK